MFFVSIFQCSLNYNYDMLEIIYVFPKFFLNILGKFITV